VSSAAHRRCTARQQFPAGTLATPSPFSSRPIGSTDEGWSAEPGQLLQGTTGTKLQPFRSTDGWQGTRWLVNLPDVARPPFHVPSGQPRPCVSVAVQCITQAFSSTGQGKEGQGCVCPICGGTVVKGVRWKEQDGATIPHRC
jgi:hypothetical protein